MFEVGHTSIDFLLGDVFIFDFDVEILSCREGIAFFFYLIVADADGEIVDGAAFAEGRNDFLDLEVAQAFLLCVAFFIFFAQFAGVDEHHFVGSGRFVEKEHRDVGAGGGKDVAGHGYAAVNPAFGHDFFENLLFDAALGGDEACGDHDGAFAR